MSVSVEKLAASKKLKLTEARKKILEILEGVSHPVSYEDIKSELSMDKATFYRNITKFEDEKIINSFESNDRRRYFEIWKTPHAHFICTVCNGVECLKQSCDFNLQGYEIENIIIKGICPGCLNDPA